MNNHPKRPEILRLAAELANGPAFDHEGFDIWQRYGFHITPNHFYSPIPDTSKLKTSLWERPSELPGVQMNEGAQLLFLKNVCEPYRNEYDGFARKATALPYEFHFDQYMFRMVDAEVLYSIVRHFKPARIVEIGSGFSTLVTAAACRKNLEEGRETTLTCIEPYPDAVLKEGVPGLTQLIQIPLEELDPGVFATLGRNDILFIDSSHVLRIGNDVYYEFLEVLPRLSVGVLVHVHDIFLPFDYPKEWVLKEHRFWTEQYLLQAFLCFNRAFSIVWAGSYMHYKHPAFLKQTFNSYERESTHPGSFWMQRTEEC